MANQFDPKPANFHDEERQSQRNLYSLYSTITLGVNDTAMQPYSLLTDQQRWALAFYVSQFYATSDDLAQGKRIWETGKNPSKIKTLKQLSLLTPDQATREGKEDARLELLYLRQYPEVIISQLPTEALQISINKLTDSLNAYRNGKNDLAYELAASAYLDGFELTEGALKGVAPDLRKHVELNMSDYRHAIKNEVSVEALESQYDTLINLLHEANQRLKKSDESISVILMSSILILLREGLEAILVLASIAGLLVKANRSHHMGFVHAGWITALLLGMGVWYAAHHFIDISGMRRELAEGIAALIAAGMLLYVGFWLHNNANAHRWRQFIHGSLKNTAGKKALWGLAFIAFIAVFREVLETVLFYETFWLQSTPKGQQFIIFGFFIALFLLVAISWLIFKLSLKLPLRKFFIVNAGILFVLSLIYSGKGIMALQEAGKLSSNPVPFIEIDLLGIYPTMETLMLQGLILVAGISWIVYQRKQPT